jgi:hypothetical protein
VIGFMLSPLILLIVSGSVAEKQPDPVNRIIEAVEYGRDLPTDVFEPKLSERQISRFEDLRGCRAMGQYASTNQNRVLSWSCENGRRYFMEATVMDNQITDIKINHVLIWSKRGAFNG